VKFAIAARDVRGGEQLGPDDFIFISIEEAKERFKKIKLNSFDSLDAAVKRLESLLENQSNDKSKYQSLLEENPKCYLLIGYNLTDEQRKKIVVKEGMNPSIRVQTYEDFLICSKSTIQFVKNHKGKLEVDTTADNSG